MSIRGKISVFENAEQLSEAAALFIVDKAGEAIKKRGRFTIALSGGNTPEGLFARLSQSPYRDSIDWSKVFVFWGDERVVPADDQRNNSFKAKEILLDKVDIPHGNIYKIATDISPETSASQYEDTIRHFFAEGATSFDLILLGIGNDGHTASLFPFTDALNDSGHLVASLYLKEQEMYRITMTAQLINMALNVLFLISGDSKAAILHTVIDGEKDTRRYPAQMINPHDGGLYWYIDKGAAELLESI